MTDPAFVLCPYRFSDQPPEMIEFLRTLGLTATVTSPSDSFAILAGSSGRVAVHDTKSATSTVASGDTRLCFETRDADDAASYLQANGITAAVVDEAYGRHLDVPEWKLHQLGINEQMRDFYGYHRHEDPTPGPIDVVAVWFTDDFGESRHVLRHLGFEPDGGDEHWQPLRASGPHGIIGLHGIGQETRRPTTGIALGFQTSEALGNLVARLQSAGYSDAEMSQADGLRRVVVTDPDGQRIEIFPSEP